MASPLDQGPTYPNGQDRIGQTKLSRLAQASWSYEGKISLTPQLAADIKDKTKISRVRAQTHFELIPTAGTGYYRSNKNQNFPKMPSTAQNRLQGQLATTRPGGSSAGSQNVDLAAGQSTTRPFDFTLAVLSQKGASESQSDYLTRLANENGKQLTARAQFTPQSGTATTQEHTATQRVPVLSLDKSGPEQATSGQQVSYRFNILNSGSAAATNLNLRDAVDGGQAQSVQGAPQALDPAASATPSYDYDIPFNRAEGGLSDTATLSWKDARGNDYGQLSDSFTTQVSKPIEPPDPGANSDSDPEKSNVPLADANKFLYEGDDAVQFGVASGAIDRKRGAVVRGSIRDRNGDPVAGVTVTVKDRPEFGSAESQPDGSVYMMVNGGGSLTVRFEKPGYIDVNRTFNVPWDDYAFFDDVVLTQYDSAATDIDVSTPLAPAQVARANPVTDEDGTRRPTLFVPEGTTANMRMPNGTLQQLDNMRVRMTEFTVGERGEAAMPAPLPATTAYTWAADFSVDEAEAAGAESVEFSQPVIGYIENFIDFPVGTTVPSGSYDEKAATWVPEKNGKVIKIVSESGGLANIDTDGNGSADPGLSVSQSERQKLALLYEPGDELWRVPTEHFSWVDWNYPPTIPSEAEVDPGGGPRGQDVGCPSAESGSVIECENQTVGENVGVAGTSELLHYRSSRAEGREDVRTVRIRLTDSTPPASLQEIRVEVLVAGRRSVETVQPSPGRVYSFTWDGRDLFGRKLSGRQTATIKLGYVYPEYSYGVPSEIARSFASRASGTFGGSVNGRGRVIIFRTYVTSVGVSDQRATGLGGWSLSSNHSYDPRSRTLSLGSGGNRTADQIEPIAERIDDYPGFGAEGVDAGPDGSVYIADFYNDRVRKIDPNGRHTTVAGRGQIATSWNSGTFSGDGGIATEADINGPSGVIASDRGVFYVLDSLNRRIREVDESGIIRTVVGGGSSAIADGARGIEVSANPVAMNRGPDGALYFANGDGCCNGAIYKLDADKTIQRVAGFVNSNRFVKDPRALAVGLDGSVYSADGAAWNGLSWSTVTRYLSDGREEIAAGTSGLPGFGGDGGPGAAANIDGAAGLDVDANGNLYIADWGNSRIRKLAPDGTITTIAGSREVASGSGSGGPATRAGLNLIKGVAAAPDGSIYAGAWSSASVWRIRKAMPGLSDGDITVPSEDGSELYVFNKSGRHLRTVDTQSGQVKLRFSYDSEGRLTKLTDINGEETRIDHDAQGNPTQIVGPDGQTTELEVNADGYLKTIRDPADKETRITYYDGGLLKTFKDNNGNTSTMTYDSLGRLIKDEDPEGGFKSLSRTETDNGREVTLTTAQGKTKKFGPEDLPTGDTRRTRTGTDGKQSTQIRGTDGSRNMTYPDGTTVKVERGPDPRFGMQAAFPKRIETKSGSRTSVTTATRTATLADQSDPLSHTKLESSSTTNGRLSKEVFDRLQRRVTTTSPTNRTTTTSLDSKGRPVQVAVPGIDSTSFSYDNRGRPTGSQQGTRATSVTYDAQGNVATSTDSLNRTQRYTYDAVGRVKTQTLPDSRVISYEYDANGNLTSITPPSRPAHIFTYNGVDKPVDYIAPDLGPDTRTARTTYTQDQEVAFIDRPGSADIDFDYDSAGRLDSITEPIGSYDFNYWEDTGQLKNIQAPGGVTTAFNYDGALALNETQAGPVAGTTSRTYDDNFWVTSTSVNSGSTVSFGYDNDGLLTSAGPLTLQRSAQNGLLLGTTLGNTQTTITPNSYGEAQSLQATSAGSSLLSQIYTRDNGGRVDNKQEATDLGSSTFNYTYDAAGRLTEVKRNGATQAIYGYDPNGNRTSVTKPGQGMLLASYDAQDRLNTYGTKSFQYTQAGDLDSMSDSSNGQTTDYSYDAQGGLRAVRIPSGDQIEYLIDGRGQRVGKKVNGSLRQGFLYGVEAQGPAAELKADGSLEARFVYGTRSNVADYMTKNGRTYRIVTDALGSPRVVVDTADGTIVQRMDFDEFGKVIRDTNPGFQPFGYAGGLYDKDTKLVRFGARDYDPEIGRWTSKDPIGFSGGDTNLYGYVLADPVNITDQDGLLVPLVVGAVVVGGAVVGTMNAVDQAQSCDDGFWAVSKAFGRGFAGGSAGTAAGIGTTLLVTRNPVAGGMVGGAVDSSVQGLLGGGQSTTDIGTSAVVGGATAGLGPKLPFTRPLYKYPGRRPDLFAPRGPGTSQSYGINSRRYLRQQGVEAGAGEIPSSAGCTCD